MAKYRTKGRWKTTKKRYNKKIDIEIARLESERKPRVKRNGVLIDTEQDIANDIKELHSLKHNERQILPMFGDSNRISSAYFSTPCVYRLWEGSTLVYVGQTNNLARRISQHQEDKVFDSFDIYTHIDNIEIRLATEKRLIERFRPKYNIVHCKTIST